MFDDMAADRRSVLKTLGTLGVGAAATGAGLTAFTGSAVAGHTSIEDAEATTVTTDDGEIEFVSFGGKLRYDWDGLDTEAHYGRWEIQGRVKDSGGTNLTSWQTLGASEGELGSNWGGSNDPDSGKGTEGYFTFRYGHPHNQRDYAVSYIDSVNATEHDLILVDANQTKDGNQPPFDTSHFDNGQDGSEKTTYLQLAFRCSVLDADKNEIGVPDQAKARLPVDVINEAAEGHTSGYINGSSDGA